MNWSMCRGLNNHWLSCSPEVAVCTSVHVYICAAKVSDIFLALQMKPQTHNSHHYLPDVHLRAHAHNSHTTHRSHFNPTMHKQPLEHFLTCAWTLITTLQDDYRLITRTNNYTQIALQYDTSLRLHRKPSYKQTLLCLHLFI